jgi:5-methylcytosine-specific restriction endonuclease McrA
MTLCPYCGEFQATTKCLVPGCGGLVCPCSNRCNRSERFDPESHAAQPLRAVEASDQEPEVPGIASAARVRR